MVHGLAAIRSVPPRATNEEWFTTLVTFITSPAEASAKSLELLLWRHIYVCFRAGEVCWNKDISINVSCTTNKREALQGKLSQFYTLRYS